MFLAASLAGRRVEIALTRLVVAITQAITRLGGCPLPMMGGVVDAAGIGGRIFGSTRASDLAPQGKVYSYRSVLKTLLDALGADHSTFFPDDPPITDFFG